MFEQKYTILYDSFIMRAHQLSAIEADALRLVRNSILQNGRAPSVRDLQKALKYKSPRSAFLILSTLVRSGFIKRRSNGRIQIVNDLEENTHHARTVDVPLVGAVACGAPILAEENIEAMIPVSRSFVQPGHRHFLLRAKGESMVGAGIQDGDVVLVRQQSVAKNGDIVVALIDDEATLKEFRRSGDAITLKPHNKKFNPIILKRNFQVQGVVVAKGLSLE